MIPLLGRATIEAYFGPPVVEEALVMEWVSLTDGWAEQFPRPAKGRIIANLESHLGPEGYRELLAGRYDARLRNLRAVADAWAPGIDWRFDHEMDGPPLDWRTWSGMDPGLSVAARQHVASILGPLMWTPTSNQKRWAPYWPGQEATSVVGWSQYHRTDPLPPFPGTWRRRIEACRDIAGDTPIIVPELGSLVGIPQRAKQLRTLEEVEGVLGACYFDVAVANDDWRMVPAMRAAWAALRALPSPP